MVIERAQTQWKELDEHIQWCEERIAAQLKQDEQAKQASQLMGIGRYRNPSGKHFKSGAQLGAWLGLTPKELQWRLNTLGSITKRGDMYVRMLLIQSDKAAVLTANHWDDPISKWELQLR